MLENGTLVATRRSLPPPTASTAQCTPPRLECRVDSVATRTSTSGSL